MSTRTFVVVLKASSAIRLLPDEHLSGKITTNVGLAKLTIRTNYVNEGFTDTVPRELWTELVVKADVSLNAVISAATEAANNVVPALVVSANAPCDMLKPHIAYDATPGANVHEFFENFLPDEGGLPRHGRRLDIPSTVAFLDSLEVSGGKRDRLLRACEFYRNGLSHWEPGSEIQAVNHLWMAVETLTPVALEHALRIESCATFADLGRKWGHPEPENRRAVMGAVRSRIVFHDENAIARSVREASDGFEHGYMPFDEVRQRFMSVRDDVASHVRMAIFELASLSSAVQAALNAEKYRRVRLWIPWTTYVRGEFVGPADKLAAADQQYPFLRSRRQMKDFVRKKDGTADVTPETTITVQCGDGITFRNPRFELWGPPNDPLAPVDADRAQS